MIRPREINSCVGQERDSKTFITKLAAALRCRTHPNTRCGILPLLLDTSNPAWGGIWPCQNSMRFELADTEKSIGCTSVPSSNRIDISLSTRTRTMRPVCSLTMNRAFGSVAEPTVWAHPHPGALDHDAQVLRWNSPVVTDIIRLYFSVNIPIKYLVSNLDDPFERIDSVAPWQFPVQFLSKSWKFRIPHL